MAIISAEILKYKAAVHDNTTANGGRMSAVEIASNVKNNVFPDVSEIDRTAGITQYRKVFHKVANADNDVLNAILIHLLTIAAGDDYLTLMLGAQRDTQADIIATPPRQYGIATLHTQVNSGGSVLIVDAESSTPVLFITGDTIAIIDGETVLYYENVTVSKNSAQYTLTLDTGDTVPSTLVATTTLIASCIEVASSDPTSADWTEDSAEGTYNESTYPVELDNIGTIEEDITITFTSATAFSVAGDTVGALASGSILADYIPLHPVFALPYFTLRSAGFAGTWANGDTITFTTHPAAVPVWRKRVVPVASAYASVDGCTVRTTGQAT
jgi:hypothetical protein